ncbi:hypothetical protein N8A90_21890 [Variovorax sp. N23]|nr:hypothetical protein [Variovorax sp. N23]
MDLVKANRVQNKQIEFKKRLGTLPCTKKWSSKTSDSVDGAATPIPCSRSAEKTHSGALHPATSVAAKFPDAPENLAGQARYKMIHLATPVHAVTPRTPVHRFLMSTMLPRVNTVHLTGCARFTGAH